MSYNLLKPFLFLLLMYLAGSLSRVCQPLDRIIICRVESGQTANELLRRTYEAVVFTEMTYPCFKKVETIYTLFPDFK